MIEHEIRRQISILFKDQFQAELNGKQIQLQETRSEFEGDITLVVFPLVSITKKSPEETGKIVGEYLVQYVDGVESYNVVKGFLNIVYKPVYWLKFLGEKYSNEKFGLAQSPSGKMYVVEYSSPNTNKPLHLGHLRNNFIGYSVAEILKANGHEVKKVQIINDRGIHICKSMLAWQKSGLNETPESTGLKGDKLVGKYYVEFDKELKKQTKPIEEALYDGDFEVLNTKEAEDVKNHLVKIQDLKSKLRDEEEVLKGADVAFFKEMVGDESTETKWKACLKRVNEKYEADDKKLKQYQKLLKPLIAIEEKMDELKDLVKDLAQSKTEAMNEAQEMLRQWEAGDKAVIGLWKKMNGWVYDGFNQTYKTLRVDFDKLYYESDTYILGKDLVEEGLNKGVFKKKEDGSVWVDNTDAGLDEKILLRKDGTSVYMTQDLGTAVLRYKDFPNVNGMIYTVGNEQDHHFKVLFATLKKLGYDWANECYHLSYGMVDLPSGKMKSREGTVVDADDLVADMVSEAERLTNEKGKAEGLSEEDKKALYDKLALAALKYFILKVDPKKRMLFNPEESIDFHGNTGPFIQYIYARTNQVLEKVEHRVNAPAVTVQTNPEELSVIQWLNKFSGIVKEAGDKHSPAEIANYIYELAKRYSHFYQTCPILKPDIPTDVRDLRLAITQMTGSVIKTGMGLLGIEVPKRM